MNGAIVFNPLWVFMCGCETKALSVWLWGLCLAHISMSKVQSVQYVTAFEIGCCLSTYDFFFFATADK